MTKEEIQKNSEHWYNKYKDAEKRIAELEKENAELKDHLAEEVELHLHAEDYIKSLEQQIEKMKNYLNCENYGKCGNSMGCPCDKWECIEK